LNDGDDVELPKIILRERRLFEKRNTLAVWQNAWSRRGLAPFFAATYRIHELDLDREKRGLTPTPRTTLLQTAKVLLKNEGVPEGPLRHCCVE
jgi:hypothetical protein